MYCNVHIVMLVQRLRLILTRFYYGNSQIFNMIDRRDSLRQLRVIISLFSVALN